MNTGLNGQYNWQTTLRYSQKFRQPESPCFRWISVSTIIYAITNEAPKWFGVIMKQTFWIETSYKICRSPNFDTSIKTALSRKLIQLESKMRHQGAWGQGAQSVQHPTPDFSSEHDLRVGGSAPSRATCWACSLLPILSLSLYSSPPPVVLSSLSLLKKRKKVHNHQGITVSKNVQ